MAKIAFTAGRVSGFKCPPDKKQAFLWDVTAPGLGLRATPAGKPAYVFQSVYQGKDLRITIGSPAAWSIPDAQAKARELQRLIDEGKDPRELKREALAAHAEKQAATVAKVQADKLAALTEWEVEPLHHVIQSTADELALGMGKVGMPLRVAVTGLGQSPSIDAVMQLVGRERVLARLDRVIAQLASQAE